MSAPATPDVRPAMIPWIIVLLLSFAAGSFAPAAPSNIGCETSEVTMLSQVGEDATLSGRTSSTPIKLPTVSWDMAEPIRPVAYAIRIESDGGHWLRQFACSQERGRAPPVLAAI